MEIGMRKFLLQALAGLLLSSVVGFAQAVDNVLLIQLLPNSEFRVWHTEGLSQLSDDEVLDLEGSALPEGGPQMITAFGRAQAFETPLGVVIRLPDANGDPALLVDRDGCGHIRLWHAAGATNLPEPMITEIYMQATAEGSPRIDVGSHYAKAFITPLGVTAAIWAKPAVRKSQ
jgi:hypothetical protein